jgi:hypothetical protein
VVISGETPSSISIGTTTGAIALHFAEAEPISRSNSEDISISSTKSSARGSSSARSQPAPSIARIGPRFDQANMAMKCAAKNAITRNGATSRRPSTIIRTTSRCERMVPTARP